MPAITNKSGQLVDTVLTNLGRKYTPQGFVAEQLAPRVSVANEGGKYAVWAREDFHRTDTNPLVADRSQTKRVDFGVSLESYSLEEYRLGTTVSARERANAANLLSLRETKVQGTKDLIALHREVRVATALKKTSTGQLNLGAAPSNNWNVDAGTIEADIVTAKEAIYDVIGRPPTHIVIPWKVANAIATQQDIREVLKYTVNGADLLRQGENALPNVLWGLQVIVPMGPSITTSAEDNATQTFTEVWGDDVRVLYLGGVNQNAPGPIHTLQTRGFQVSSYFEDDPPGLESILVSDGILQEKVVAPDAGYEIQDVLAG